MIVSSKMSIFAYQGEIIEKKAGFFIIPGKKNPVVILFIWI